MHCANGCMDGCTDISAASMHPCRHPCKHLCIHPCNHPCKHPLNLPCRRQRGHPCNHPCDGFLLWILYPTVPTLHRSLLISLKPGKKTVWLQLIYPKPARFYKKIFNYWHCANGCMDDCTDISAASMHPCRHPCKHLCIHPCNHPCKHPLNLPCRRQRGHPCNHPCDGFLLWILYPTVPTLHRSLLISLKPGNKTVWLQLIYPKPIRFCKKVLR